MWTKMLIEVKRYEFNDTYTVGKMYINNVYFCYTLEDVVRKGAKVNGKTAIPVGTYYQARPAATPVPISMTASGFFKVLT